MQKSNYNSNNIGNKKGATESPWTGFYCNTTDPVFWIKSGKRTFRCGSLELTLKEKRDQFTLPGQWTGWDRESFFSNCGHCMCMTFRYGRSVALLRRLHIWTEGLHLPCCADIIIISNIFQLSYQLKMGKVLNHYHHCQYRHRQCQENAACLKDRTGMHAKGEG